MKELKNLKVVEFVSFNPQTKEEVKKDPSEFGVYVNEDGGIVVNKR